MISLDISSVINRNSTGALRDKNEINFSDSISNHFNHFKWSLSIYNFYKYFFEPLNVAEDFFQS